MTVAAYSEPVTPAYTNRRNKTPRHGFNKPQSAVVIASSAPAHSSVQSSSNNDNARRYKPKISPSNVEAGHNNHQSTSIYKFKLNRSPGRWQYKTSPKPRVAIRKQNMKGGDANVADSTVPNNEPSIDSLPHEELNEAQIVHPISNNDPQNANSRSDEGDLDSSGSIKGDVLNDDDDTLYNVIENRKLPVETLKVEISTPADFRDTYYEIATIKSPYTFQVNEQLPIVVLLNFILNCF